MTAGRSNGARAADSEATRATAVAEGFEPSPERTHRTCPVCGHELEERKCKLFCPRPGCGYFLSCADYY